MKIVGLLGILLVALGLGCSRQSSREPVTVTFLDIEYDTPDRLPGLAQDLLAFTQETGIRVKRLPRPEGSLNQLAMWRELLQKGGATPDVYGIDVIWSGIFNQYLLDLKPYFATELSSQRPVVAASYTVGDKLVAIPRHAYVGVLLYRADLLRRYGYREPPKTWDELERMATRIQAGERAKGQKDFWGYVWQGGVSEDLTCAGLEWQMSERGGRIIEDDRTISVNNPQTIRTWQRAARWVGSISPPGVVAYEKWDAENVWKSGKAAFHRAWVSDYSLITLHTPPGNATQYGVTSLPGGIAGRANTLGGNGLAVSRTSAHPREALELIGFLVRRDHLMRASANSVPPKEQELYDLPEILEPYPQFAASRQHPGRVVARPSIVSGEKYEDVSRAYIRALHSVLTGEQIPAVAAAALEKELIQITGFRPGAPSN
ncbi:MAG: Maltose/maltodextrin transporter, substrate binding periplasmic protein MalE [Candidatus Acidoferrum typicum]|nr:Maltose/maltodextrin transporter, substrate binding periplasmic protein MalE [Candidatus Acidoferrum typicum]